MKGTVSASKDLSNFTKSWCPNVKVRQTGFCWVIHSVHVWQWNPNAATCIVIQTQQRYKWDYSSKLHFLRFCLLLCAMHLVCQLYKSACVTHYTLGTKRQGAGFIKCCQLAWPFFLRHIFFCPCSSTVWFSSHGNSFIRTCLQQLPDSTK